MKIWAYFWAVIEGIFYGFWFYMNWKIAKITMQALLVLDEIEIWPNEVFIFYRALTL